jgi:TM2 domain-containing membrane protein YozV
MIGVVKRYPVLFILITVLTAGSLRAQPNNDPAVLLHPKKEKLTLKKRLKTKLKVTTLKVTSKLENKKLVATGLAITLGVFGVHRLYLGTHEKVPVIYTLTLGGGFFLLPAIDIISILTTKDISKYENNPRIFMWANNGEKKED